MKLATQPGVRHLFWKAILSLWASAAAGADPAFSSLEAMTGPDKARLDQTPPAAPASPYELLPTGYRRVTRMERQPLAERVQQAIEQSGKSAEIDPRTGERIIRAFVDYLPEQWGTGESHASEMPVDSLGRPIVNTAPGLPGWAKADVDALRAAIGHWLDVRTEVAATGQDPTETDGILGNFVGQAIVRGIAFDDLLRLDNATLIGDVTAQASIGYLHFYEHLKFAHAGDGGYPYQPTAYSPEVAAFVSSHGENLGDVLNIELPQEAGMRGGPPSGCYTRTTFARGMSLLSGPTNIWEHDGSDDEFADISTGLPIFFFYECDDADNNDMVRVSTNGYMSFFQQGGGAAFGTSFGNDPIPLAEDPDGYIAPWWDDLDIATAQGSSDRVSYKTEGATDQRVFTVEWFSVSRQSGDVNDYHSFQIKLYETTGVIELHFGLNVAGWQTDTADNATVGMETYDGSDGDCGPNCLNTNNPPPPNDYRFTPPRPFNDVCADAEVLHYRESLTQVSLRNATADGEAGCGASNNNRDVWYTFAAGCAGTLSVDTCGTRDANGDGTGPDTVLSVHSACPGTAANELACSDDAGVSGCSGNDSAVSVTLANNQQVWIRVTHFGDLAFRIGNGLFDLHTEFVPNTPPVNDQCGNGTTVTSGSTHLGNLRCASPDGEADCGNSIGNPDIWYRFAAPAQGGGRLALDLCGSRNNGGVDAGPDTVLSVHSACQSQIGNQLVCNDDGLLAGCNVLDSSLSVPLGNGQAVRIRVSHFGTGLFRLGNGRTMLHVGFCTADSNCDGRVDGLDVSAFVLAILNSATYAARYPGCDRVCHNDMNGDGAVDRLDIPDFIKVLTSP